MRLLGINIEGSHKTLAIPTHDFMFGTTILHIKNVILDQIAKDVLFESVFLKITL